MADTALAVSFTRVTGERFLRETTRELDFPYCSKCVRHSRWWTVAWRAAAVVMAVGALAGAGLGFGVGLAAGAGAAAAGGVVAVLVGLALRAKAESSRCPACTGAGPAVTYHGWANQVQTFSFSSRRYAAAFAEQNEQSLVNVTPHLYQLVEQQRVSAPPRAAAAMMIPSALAPPVTVSSRPKKTPAQAEAALAEPPRETPQWPQRGDRARALLDHVMRINGAAIQVDGMKRPGRAS